jgi:D-3-phosphoglycerate dehydrogenase
VLAHVFDQLRRVGINVQETENVIFEGAEAAVARINLDGSPSLDALASLRSGNDDILDVRVVPL